VITEWRQFVSAVHADHETMRTTRDRYPTEGTSMKSHGTIGDFIHNIGFQMLVAVRMMHLAKNLGIPLLPQVFSRLIRHLYGAEIHWNAQIAPGVTLVHGTGLVISHGAKVGTGCILFQHVTLGESIDPLSRTVGAPTLDNDVHVGPGAVLLGPIEIGARSKVMANCVVDRSIAAGSIVRGASIEVVTRGTTTAPTTRQADSQQARQDESDLVGSSAGEMEGI
jgi:serine O-acetyltransferase